MLETVCDTQALIRLAEPWNALAAGFANPFLRHECAVACAQSFCDHGIVVLAVRSGGSLRAVAPFRVIRRAGVKRLEMITRIFGEPTGFLFSDEAALSELLDAMLGCGQPLMLGRLSSDGPEMRMLRDKLGTRRMLRTTAREDSSLWVELPGTWGELEKGMSSSRLSYIRRKRRRAERLGQIEFSAFAPEEAAVEPLLDQAFRIEAANWKGRNGTAILLNPVSRRFFTLYCRAAAREGMLRLFFLKIGGEAAAMRMAVVNAGRLWEIKIGYDERFHDCSPGVLLTHETLHYCCDAGLAGFEFLGLAEEWEHAWTERVHHYTSLNLHPPSIGGVLSLSQDTGWTLAKGALGALRLDKDSRKDRSRRASAAAAAAARRNGGDAAADGGAGP